MALFLKEEDFCKYLSNMFQDHEFSIGNSVVSINVTKMTPLMSCIYLDDNHFAAAKYNRQMGIFSDGFMISLKEISNISLVEKGVNSTLQIDTNEILQDGTNLSLTLNLSTMTALKWHKKNLAKLKVALKASSSEK